MAFPTTASGSFALAFAAAVATVPAARAADLAVPGKSQLSAKEQCVANAVDAVYASGPLTYVKSTWDPFVFEVGRSFKRFRSDRSLTSAHFKNAAGNVTVVFARWPGVFKADITHVSNETPPRTSEVGILRLGKPTRLPFGKGAVNAPLYHMVDYMTSVTEWQSGIPNPALFLAGPTIKTRDNILVVSGKNDGGTPWRETHAAKLHDAVGNCGLQESNPAP